MTENSNRVAVVTGGARVRVRAVAEALAADNIAHFLADISSDRRESTQAELAAAGIRCST
jgi:NAD(P)-dependent dehydrogenase (short-subunit alcohol dehydrogenase family)